MKGDAIIVVYTEYNAVTMDRKLAGKQQETAWLRMHDQKIQLKTLKAEYLTKHITSPQYGRRHFKSERAGRMTGGFRVLRTRYLSGKVKSSVVIKRKATTRSAVNSAIADLILTCYSCTQHG